MMTPTDSMSQPNLLSSVLEDELSDPEQIDAKAEIGASAKMTATRSEDVDGYHAASARTPKSRGRSSHASACSAATVTSERSNGLGVPRARGDKLNSGDSSRGLSVRASQIANLSASSAKANNDWAEMRDSGSGSNDFGSSSLGLWADFTGKSSNEARQLEEDLNMSSFESIQSKKSDRNSERQPANAVSSSGSGFKAFKSEMTFGKGLTKQMTLGHLMSFAYQAWTEPTNPYRQAAQNFVNQPWFDGVMGFAVAVNALCLAAETEVPQNLDTQSFFRTSDLVFLAIFTFEFLLRIFAYGLGCLRAPVMALDAVIVLAGWVTEIIIPIVLSSEPDVDLDVLQTLKVLRVLRAVRVLRMLTMFKDLWLVVQSFFLCLRPLVWTVMFILIIIFLFAMFAVELIGRGFDDQDLAKKPTLRVASQAFTSTVPAMVSLFQIMTLDTWHKLVLPIFNEAPWTYLFFLVYIAVSALALMNLVTAIVVDTATQGTAKEEEFQRRAFDAQVQKMTEEIKEMFFLMDADGAGSIDEQEFIDYGLEIKMIQDFCDTFDLEDESAVLLFKVMLNQDDDERADDEEVNALDMKALLQGMMKLHRITQDQNAVALIRAARTDKDRFNHLKHAFTKQSGDASKLRGSLQGRLEQMDQQMQKLSREASGLHFNLKKFCKQVGVEAPSLIKSAGGMGVSRQVSRVSGAHDEHTASAGLGMFNVRSGLSACEPTASGGLGMFKARSAAKGAEASRLQPPLQPQQKINSSPSTLAVPSHQQHNPSPSLAASHDDAGNESMSSWCGSEIVDGEGYSCLDLELRNINRTVEVGVKELRQMVASHLEHQEQAPENAPDYYPVQKLCKKLELPVTIQNLFDSEGFQQAQELAVLPAEQMLQLLQRPEVAELTFGQLGRLLLELSGLRLGREVFL